MLKAQFSLLFLAFLISPSLQAESQCFALFSKQTTVQGMVRQATLSVLRGEEEFFKSADEFTYMDTTYHFSFTGHLSKKGVLTLSVYLVDQERGIRSIRRGDDLYEEMIEHFGIENINAIEGSWWNGTNYDGFLRAYNGGATAKEAALQTWSGEQAKKYGFEQVETILFRQKKGESLMRELQRPAMPAEIVVLFTMK